MWIGDSMIHNIIFYEKENGQSEIWDFRPGNNRIFYFFCDDNSFVLLHSFRKKTQKTPRREISKAKSERDDYLSRKDNC
mgnify:CR=1 FL=1